MAGYSETPLVKKLGIKPGFDVAFVNPPEDFVKQLELPSDVNIRSKSKSKPVDFILVFVKSQKNLIAALAQAARNKTQRNALGILAKENIRRVNGRYGKYRARYWFGCRSGRREGLRDRRGLVRAEICLSIEGSGGAKLSLKLRQNRPLTFPQNLLKSCG